MTDKEIIEKAYDYCEKETERYYDLAFNALEKGNMQANAIHASEASVFGRVSMYIQMLSEENNNE